MITHRFIESRNYAYIEVTQNPTLVEYCRAAKLFAEDPRYKPELNRICDFSQADLGNITLSDINAFATYAKEHVPIRVHTKIALVPPSANKMGIFETFSSHIDAGNVRLFQDPEEAVAWVQTESRPHLVIRTEVRQQIRQHGGTTLVPATLENIAKGNLHLLFTLILVNKGEDTAYNVVFDNPIPKHTTYSLGSADGIEGRVMCSCDNGRSYHSEDEQLHLQRSCTNIRWVIDKVPPRVTHEYHYQLIINDFSVVRDSNFQKWLSTGTF